MRISFAAWSAMALLLVSGTNPSAAPAPTSPSPVQQPSKSTLLPTIDRAKGDFSLIVLPDTQRYARFYPNILRSQIDWILDQQTPLNVQYVLHLGDLTDEDTQPEWTLIDEVFGRLDGHVPYLVVPGNHDYDRKAFQLGKRGTSQFNATFSPYRFQRRPWYGGHYRVTNDNNFGYFEAAGTPFMVLGLEYGPTDDVLDWANQLVDTHEATPHRVIVVTHAYMYNDNTRLGPGDDHSPHKKDASWNDGEQIWDKFVRRHDNIAMVLSGHVTANNDGTGLLISKTDGGGSVVQMLSNYQFMEHGGAGYLRILVFRPSASQLDVFTYSPWFDRRLEDADNQFSVPMPIFKR